MTSTKYIICFLMVLTLMGCSATSYNTKPQANVSGIKAEMTDINNIKRDIHQTVKQKTILDVPIIKQNPELKKGCEVTSLAMVLQYAGIKVNKMELAEEISKDNDPLVKNDSGDITHWGDPNHGFVGDITGKNKGYAVYDKPVEQLMKQYLPERTLNLTGKSFDVLLEQIRNEKPVMVWTTGNFKSPDTWESWNHEGEEIKATFDLHAVVLTGFDPDFVYINDPLTGNKGQKINMQSFIDSWVALGKKALSYN